MTDDPYSNVQTPDAPMEVPSPDEVSTDVPVEVDTLADGRQVEVIGDVRHLASLATQQGDNPYGYSGDCGLVCCRNIFRQFGMDSTEEMVVGYAINHGLCDAGQPDAPPEECGGTTPYDRVQILNDNGVPSHIWQDSTADDLAGFVQAGRGVIISVNAGVLWDDPNYVEGGQTNHVVTVIGVLRDPQTQALEGFVVNDSGNGKTTVVSTDLMDQCFVQKGGVCVVTDNSAPPA